MTARAELIGRIAATVDGIRLDRTVLVGIDGVDGAGKTRFADELGAALRALGRPVIRAGVDSFHNPRAVRYRRGRDSPDGYFLDSFDYPALRRVLLDPLRAGGPHRVAFFDHRTDSAVVVPEEGTPAGAVLVFDGIFLHRPELAGYWDYSMFLRVDFEVSIPRVAARDGCSADPAASSNRRYVDGQRHYLARCRPAERASIVVDNHDLSAPYVARCQDVRNAGHLGRGHP